tara:strand:- start:48315 stop:48578 length:264 start_codon:yes stop_codon:yes gene_type:complete
MEEYRSVFDLLKDMPKGDLHDKILRNLSNRYNSDIKLLRFRNHERMIRGGFTWRRTIEGMSFWRDVAETIEDYVSKHNGINFKIVKK